MGASFHGGFGKTAGNRNALIDELEQKRCKNQ